MWTWKAGFTEITLPWAAQVRPAGGATAHLTMLAGRYGGLATYQVGFAAFLKLAFAIKAGLVPAAQVAGQEFTEPVTFAPIAAALPPARAAVEPAPRPEVRWGDASAVPLVVSHRGQRRLRLHTERWRR